MLGGLNGFSIGPYAFRPSYFRSLFDEPDESIHCVRHRLSCPDTVATTTRNSAEAKCSFPMHLTSEQNFSSANLFSLIFAFNTRLTWMPTMSSYVLTQTSNMIHFNTAKRSRLNLPFCRLRDGKSFWGKIWKIFSFSSRSALLSQTLPALSLTWRC